MVKLLFSEYRHSHLKVLTEKLHKDYYVVIEGLTKNASRIADSLNETTMPAAAVLYLSLCAKVLRQVEDVMQLRQTILIPYVEEICAAADIPLTGQENGDYLSQDTRLSDIRESHRKIKELFFRLQMVALPLYSDTAFPPGYKMLRNEMMLIDTALTELFYLEESSLIPGVLEARKKNQGHA